MLILGKKLASLRFAELTEVYGEGCRENGRAFYPLLPEQEQLLQAQQDFYAFLRDDFFRQPGAVYAIWEENGRYCSALRLQPYRDGLLLEALETAVPLRRRGYAEKLVRAVLDHVSRQGGGRVYSHVSRRNVASQAVHRACGFEKVLDYAVYVDGSVLRGSDTLCCDCPDCGEET